MRPLRVLLTATTLLVVAASALSAQGKVSCKDGTKSAGGRGACSGHGGIVTAAMKSSAKADAKAAKKADAKAAATAKAETKAASKAATATAAKTNTAAAKADKKATTSSADDNNPAGAIAECKDHTYSHAKTHRGACSRHGGVAKFLDGKK
jgi:membrane protein involved in colicin uptake